MTDSRSDVDAVRAAYDAVLARIAAACARAGRDPSGVTLVAVSKTVDVHRLRQAVEAGITTLGENRVQEAAAKVGELPGVTWHLVGPLQSNKARRALETFHVIQTVDTVALAERLDGKGRPTVYLSLFRGAVGYRDAEAARRYGTLAMQRDADVKELDEQQQHGLWDLWRTSGREGPAWPPHPPWAFRLLEMGLMRVKRVRCAAMSRNPPRPCGAQALANGCCRNHGGQSTRPSEEGRKRIAEYQRQRWAKWRAERQQKAEHQ